MCDYTICVPTQESKNLNGPGGDRLLASPPFQVSLSLSPNLFNYIFEV